MKLGKLAILVAGLTVALVSGWSSRGEAITLPACDNFICAFDGDFAVMSLATANELLPGGFKVQSAPGQIQNDIVIYTGAGGLEPNPPVKDNPAGMDDAFEAVTGVQNPTFSTTTAPDPLGTGEFTGDGQSWDSTMAAFLLYLSGNSPIFFFNQNEDNSGVVGGCGGTSEQDICVYASLTLTDTETGNTRVFELQAPTTLFSGGPTPTDGVFQDPQDIILAAGQVCYDALGNQAPCDGNQALGPINHNLGQDLAAYAAFSDALNLILAQCASPAGCVWDTISIRMELRDLTNGFEQLFVLQGPALPEIPSVPVPGTLILLGAGLMGLGASAWRRRQRG
jgi:PEP-CTERM motif